MPSSQKNREAGQKAIEAGQLVRMPQPSISDMKPIPVADYPAAPNSYSRTPLPSTYVDRPDTQRHWQSGAVPQQRIPPISATSNPIVGAQAASQAIQLIQTTPSTSSSALVSLNVPSIFTPTSQTEDASGLLAIFLANEAANSVFAGPAGTVLDEIDASAAATGNSVPISISATQAQSADIAVVFTAQDNAGGTLFNPSGWTGVISSGQQSIYTKLTGVGTVTASGSSDVTHPEWSSVLALVSAKTGFTPTVVNSHIAQSGAFGTQANLAIGFTPTAGNTLLVSIMSGSINTNGGASVISAFSDSTNGLWAAISSTSNGNDSGTQVSIFGSSNIAGGTTTISFTMSRTLSAASVIVLELSNTAAPAAVPTFRLLVGADLPFPGVAAKGGVFSNVGAATKFFSALGTNGQFTLTQPAFTDLSGNIAVSQMNSGTNADDLHFWRGDTTWARLGVIAIDVTGQNANIGSTVFSPALSPQQTGVYRISVYCIVSVAAGGSSTLPDCQLSWVDGSNNATQTIDFVAAAPSGNTLTTYFQGTAVIHISSAHTALTYQTGAVTAYASSGSPAMKYDLFLRVEAV